MSQKSGSNSENPSLNRQERMLEIINNRNSELYKQNSDIPEKTFDYSKPFYLNEGY